MKYDLTNEDITKIKTDCLVVAIYETNKLSAAAQAIDKASKGYITQLLKQGDITGKICESLLLHQVSNINASRVLLVGCGKKDDIDELKTFKIFNHALSCLLKTNSKQVVNTLSELEVNKHDQAWVLEQLIAATEIALYRFDEFKSNKNSDHKILNKQTFTAINKKSNTAQLKESISKAEAIASGVNLVKNIANQPGNVCTPNYLADQAKKLAKKHTSIHCTVLEENEMKKLNMGALLAVAQGSREKPKLITLEYRGHKNKSEKPVVFVGKGITFDSGGISLKPGLAMDEMKYDMCGAASVLGALQTIAELKLPINVVGILACAENMPGGAAIKPGDIVTSHSGKTIEILNTDAEGRLVLCDALSYCKKFNPDVVIDIATLTGAVIVALGSFPTGILSNQQNLADQLLKAGEQSYDRAWQLPLWEDYQAAMDSSIADVANLSSVPGAGSITGAAFLARFTKDYHWAHLDIAGTAWKSGKDKGATGRPVPLLAQYLINRCSKK